MVNDTTTPEKEAAPEAVDEAETPETEPQAPETTENAAEEASPQPPPSDETAKKEAPASAESSEKPEGKGSNEKSEGNDRRNRGRRGGRRRDNRQKEQKEFEESILQIDRVTRVVKGGRRMRFRVSVVIGDKKGRVGFGIGKSGEVLGAIQKAVARAKKKLMHVPIFNETIPHEITHQFKSSRVLLFPAPEGKGVIAGGAVRKILELAGVKNVLSKVHGSRNRLNIAYCTFEALAQLQNQAPHGMEVKEAEEETSEEKAPETAKKEKSEKPTKKKTTKKATAKKETAKKPAPKKTTAKAKKD